MTVHEREGAATGRVVDLGYSQARSSHPTARSGEWASEESISEEWETVAPAVVPLTAPPHLLKMLVEIRATADQGEWFAAPGAAAERRQAALPEMFTRFYDACDAYIQTLPGMAHRVCVRGRVAEHWDPERPDDFGGQLLWSMGIGYPHTDTIGPSHTLLFYMTEGMNKTFVSSRAFNTHGLVVSLTELAAAGTREDFQSAMAQGMWYLYATLGLADEARMMQEPQQARQGEGVIFPSCLTIHAASQSGGCAAAAGSARPGIREVETDPMNGRILERRDRANDRMAIYINVVHPSQLNASFCIKSEYMSSEYTLNLNSMWVAEEWISMVKLYSGLKGILIDVQKVSGWIRQLLRDEHVCRACEYGPAGDSSVLQCSRCRFGGSHVECLDSPIPEGVSVEDFVSVCNGCKGKTSVRPESYGLRSRAVRSVMEDNWAEVMRSVRAVGLRPPAGLTVAGVRKAVITSVIATRAELEVMERKDSKLEADRKKSVTEAAEAREAGGKDSCCQEDPG